MSLDPESLLGVPTAVVKAAVAGTVVGIVWRRQFAFREALIAGCSGLGAAIYGGRAINGALGFTHPDVTAGVIFVCGVCGMALVELVTTHFPQILGARLKALAPSPDKPASDKPGGNP